jgi:hypothetical protein
MASRSGWLVGGAFVPQDDPGAGAGGGDHDSRLDHNLDGIRADGSLGGLARMRQTDPDPLATDHDRASDGDTTFRSADRAAVAPCVI